MFYLSSNLSNDGGWSTFDMIAQLFFILIVFVAVVALAIVTTRWVASAKYGGGMKASRNLKIIESMSIGYQSGIHLLKCGKKYLLIGTSKDRVTPLAELTEDEVEINDEPNVNSKKIFEKYLTNLLPKNSNRKDDEDAK